MKKVSDGIHDFDEIWEKVKHYDDMFNFYRIPTNDVSSQLSLLF